MTLLAKYNFDGDLSDSSGQGNDASGSPKFGASPNGTALNIDANASNVADLPNLGISGDSSITIMATVKVNEGAPSKNAIYYQGDSTTDSAIGLRTNGDGGFRFYFWGNDVDATTPRNYYGEWVQVAARYDASSSQRKVFFNGNVVASDNPTNPNTQNNDYRIGGRPNDTEIFDGLIANVEIHDTALSHQQIIQNKQETLGTLVSEYHLDGDLKDSQKGYDGIAHGSLDYETAKKDRGLTCRQSEPNTGAELIQHTDVEHEGLSEEGTATIWFKSTTTSGDGFARIITRDLSEYPGVGINQSAASGSQDLEVHSAGTYSDSVINTNIRTNEWYHLALTWSESDGSLLIYLDGIQVASYTIDTTLDTARSFVIGANTEGVGELSGDAFEGVLDEVRFYNKQLTQEEVFDDLEKSTKNGLVGWWKLDGDTNDYSGNENHGSSSSVTYESGKIGQGINPQSTNTINCGNSDEIRDTFKGREMTWCFWWNQKSVSNPWNDVVDKGNHRIEHGRDNYDGGSYGPGYWTGLYDHNGNAHNTAVNTLSDVSVGEWFHIAITKDMDEMVVYINGERDRVLDGNFYMGSYDANSFLIGQHDPDDGVDDVRVYNRCLSDHEIQELAQGKFGHYKTFEQSLDNLYNNSSNNQGWGIVTHGNGSGTITNTTDSSIPSAPEDDRKIVMTKDTTGDDAGTTGDDKVWHGTYRSNIDPVPVEVGDTLSYSCWYKCTSSSGTPRNFSLVLYDADSGWDGRGTSYFTPIPDGKWHRMEKTVEVTESPTDGRVSPSWSWGYDYGPQTLEICGMQIQRGSSTASEFIKGPATRPGYAGDSAGYNDGELIGGAGPVDDTVVGGESARFERFGTHQLDIDTFPDPDQSFSIAMWVKPNSPIDNTANNDYRQLVSGSSYGNVCLLEQGYGYSFRVPGVDTSYFGAGSATPNEWNHVVFVYDGSNRIIYTEGTEAGRTSTPAGSPSFGGDLYMGGSSDLRSFDGELSDIRFYATALSQAEIQRIYENRAAIDDGGTLHSHELVERPPRRGADSKAYSATNSHDIAAFEDNTKVYVDGNYQTTLDKQETTYLSSGTGTIVTASKPLVSGQSLTGAPFGWWGTQFGWRNDRYAPIDVYIYSPWETSYVEIYDATSSVTSPSAEFTVPKGEMGYHETDDTNNQYILESDKPVIVSLIPGGDYRSLYPSTTELFGIPSSDYHLIGLEDNTSVDVYWSDGTSYSATVGRGEYVNPGGGSGSQYTGAGARIVSDKPIVAEAQADGDGGDALPYTGRESMATHFVLPKDAEFVSFVGLDPDATIEAYDSTGTKVGNHEVAGGTASTDPTKARLLASDLSYTLSPGTMFVASSPQWGMFENTSNNDETIFHGSSPNGNYYSGKTELPTQKGAITTTELDETALGQGDPIMRIPDTIEETVSDGTLQVQNEFDETY